MEFKESAKELTGYQWTLGKTKDVAMERFWTREKEYSLADDGDEYLGVDKCIDSKKELWLELLKRIWKKNHNAFYDHVKYIQNDIVKPF